MNQNLERKIEVIERLGFEQTFEGIKSQISFNPAATEKQLLHLQKVFDKKIPNDYISFLQKYNGCKIFKVEDIGGFTFFDVERMIRENDFQKTNYGEEWRDNIILFCSCIGDGDFIGFK